MTRAGLFGVLATVAGTTAALADDPREDFVAANLLATFYHELGHALIDQMQLPVLGQEEDAADVLSVVLLDQLWQSDDALALAQATAEAFRLSDEEAGEDVAWWDVHGPDLQRYFTTVCLIYGADPDRRAEYAEAAGLPEERAEGCVDEYDLAAASWGTYLEELEASGGGTSLWMAAQEDDSELVRLIADEVATLNQSMTLPRRVAVRFEDCGEPNAFYDSTEDAITLCREYSEYMRELYDGG